MELGIGHWALGIGHWLMYGTRSAGVPPAPVPLFSITVGLRASPAPMPNA